MFWRGLSALIFTIIGLIFGIAPELWKDQPIMKTLILLGCGVLIGISLFSAFQRYFRRHYKKRSVLGGLDEELSRAKEVWALWQTGVTARHFGDSIFRNISTLILSDPMGPYIEIMSGEVGRPVDDIVSDIRQTTQKAKSFGASVKWYSGTISETMIFGNPGRLLAWTRVESGYPKKEAGNRFGRTIYNLFDWKLYRLLKVQFEDILEKSRDAEITQSLDEAIKEISATILNDPGKREIYEKVVNSAAGSNRFPWSIGSRKEIYELKDAEEVLKAGGFSLPKQTLYRAFRWYIENDYLIESVHIGEPPAQYRYFNPTEKFLPIKIHLEKDATQ